MHARSVVLLSLALAAPAFASVGCGGSVAASPAAVSGTRAPVAQSAHGQIKFLGDALGDVPLTDAQRSQIEKLAVDADARHEQGRVARRDLLLAIAAQVEAGTIDRTALQPKIDALVAALQSTQPVDRAAFEQLHGILAPDQRVAFVDAVEARFSQLGGRGHDKLGLREWAEALKLTDAQRDQIRTVLRQSFDELKHHHDHDGDHAGAPWGDGGHRGAKILDAFKQDKFVFDQVAPPRDPGKGAAFMTDRFVAIASQVLPILTPEQRTIAAQRLRDRAGQVDLDHIP
jgi:Spy/CpxP family protein refolding chaperone